MQRLQIWCALLLGWFFVFYNTERLYAPINIASFIYVLAALAALAIVLWAPLHRAPLYVVFLVLAPIYIGLKLSLRYALDSAHLPITVTEITALAVTVLLARQLGHALEEVRGAIAGTMLSKVRNRSRSFKAGQREIHREMRRARIYRRPLALLSVAPTADTLSMSLNRFVQEVQRETIRDYAKAQLAGLISEQTKACDIIMHRNGHFVTLLPETSREEALALAERVEAAAKEQLGLNLKVGLSIFPDEEITFVRLLERAEHQMHKGEHPARSEESTAATNGHTNGDLTSAAL